MASGSGFKLASRFFREAFLLADSLIPIIQEIRLMWKLVVGFVVFAAIALFVISKAGDQVDMSGEKHGSETTHAPEPAASK